MKMKTDGGTILAIALTIALMYVKNKGVDVAWIFTLVPLIIMFLISVATSFLMFIVVAKNM